MTVRPLFSRIPPSLLAFLPLVIYLVLAEQSVLLLGLGVIGFGVAFAAVEVRLDKRKKTAKTVAHWLFNSVMLAILSGSIIVGYWYVAFASSPFPADVTYNPYVIQFEWIFDIGGIFAILSLVQFSLALIITRFPDTKLVEIVSTKTVVKVVKGALAAQWFLAIVAVLSLQYIYTVSFVSLLQLILAYGLSILNIVGWIILGGLSVTFFGAVYLVYAFLPFTRFASPSRMRFALSLMFVPIVLVVTFLLLSVVHLL